MTRDDTKVRTEKAIQSRMEQGGWKLEAVAELPPTYVLPISTTPYFLCAKPLKIRNNYLQVSGVVGVISRQFEEHLQQQRSSISDQLALSLDLTNFPSLYESTLINGEKIEEDVSSFCDVIVHLLSQFPRTEQDLREAFKMNLMAGKPMNHFDPFGRQKCLELKRFTLKN